MRIGRREGLKLIGVVILAYWLRVMFLPAGALTFGYDQARDAFVAQEIVGGDMKILGPPASTPGLYHGVLYYYFLAPAYAISKSPIVAAYWTAAFNATGGILVYLLARIMTKNKLAGLMAALMFAISFESTQYAIWLSNPTMGVWTVPMIYLGLWMWLWERKSWGAIIVGLGLGLSIQSEIFLAYHLVPVMIWVWVFRKKWKVREIINFIITSGVTLSTMILVEVKFGFQGLEGAKSLLSSGESVSHGKSLGDFLLLFLNQLGRVYAHNSFPGNVGYGAIFVLGLLIYSLVVWNGREITKNKLTWEPFLATWLLAHITVASVGGTSTPFLLVGIGPAVSILLGIYLAKWWKTQRALALTVLVVLIYGNLSMIMRENPHGQTIFSIQNDMTIDNHKAALDYIYGAAGGVPFSINTITSPLWVNTVWSYMFNWYGVENYGYLPEWHGRDQVGRLGNNLAIVNEETKLYFLISEPLQGIPPKFVEDTYQAEDVTSKLIEERGFDQVIVQKREKNNEE